jgi:hypothetical protein
MRTCTDCDIFKQPRKEGKELAITGKIHADSDDIDYEDLNDEDRHNGDNNNDFDDYDKDIVDDADGDADDGDEDNVHAGAGDNADARDDAFGNDSTVKQILTLMIMRLSSHMVGNFARENIILCRIGIA